MYLGGLESLFIIPEMGVEVLYVTSEEFLFAWIVCCHDGR